MDPLLGIRAATLSTFAARCAAALRPRPLAFAAALVALGTFAGAASATERFAVGYGGPFRGDAGSPPKVAFTPFLSSPVADAGRDLTVGPDGNIWISTYEGEIVRMTPQGVSTAFQYANGGDGYSPTPGPGGTVWFVDAADNLVGKVTMAGVVTTYPLPSNIVQGCQLDATTPISIVAGPDGAMWFTVSAGASGSLSCPQGQLPEIGRITMKGKMTFYGVPGIPSGAFGTPPIRITAGPDNKLWFTTFTNQNGATLGVGSITTGGTITLGNGFPGSSQSGNDDYLAFGADNKLYVADRYDKAIIRVAGYAAAATIPLSVNPYGIVSGIGGLWFTTAEEMLGSMTLNGHVNLYQIPTGFGNGSGGGLAFHDKNHLWFPLNGSHGSANVVRATIKS